MKNAAALQTALEGVAVPMYCSDVEVATDDDWPSCSHSGTHSEKNKFFSDQTLKDMKSPWNSMTWLEEFSSAILPHSALMEQMHKELLIL